MEQKVAVFLFDLRYSTILSYKFNTGLFKNMFAHICAVGDCNTLGTGILRGNSYPERIGRNIGARVTNLGHTMATSREGNLLLRDFSGVSDCIFIQFGLADSYTTCRYSPYVLYYPDNIIRKPLRSMLKKIKKSCRRINLFSSFGSKNVVSPEEYESNMRAMVSQALPNPVFLIDTIPHHEQWRNSHIQEYNQLLTRISKDFDQCIKIDLYDIFIEEFDTYYLDATHCNGAGYDRISEMICHKMKLLNFTNTDCKIRVP